MFWGLILEPGKRYTTTVEKSFHVSMAALDCTTVRQDQEIMSVMLETEGQESLLCNLCKQKGILQAELDLNFLTGDTVTFTCKGSGTVHLSGYLVMDDDELAEMGEEEEDEDDVDEADSGVDASIPTKKKDNPQKRKSVSASPQQQTKKKKVVEAEEDEDEEEEEESSEDDEAVAEGVESDEEVDSEELSSDEEEDDDEDEDEDEEENANTTSKLVSSQENKKTKQGGQQQQQNQKIKSQQNTPNKQQQQQTPGGKGNKTPLANGFTPQQQQQSGKKDKKKGAGQDTPGQGGQNKTPNQQKTPGGQKTPGQQANVNTPKDKSPGAGNEGSPQKKTLEGGIVIKDIRLGNGPVAKGGKMLTVYYTGKLKSNNKVFDSTTDGAGFKFRLGRGEVIKGWDTGIGGMKVGGKRIIMCPAHMAYGQKGSPPHIPPNSSLIFEVELKAVN